MPRFTVLMDVMTSCRPCFHLSLLGLLALTSVGRGATEKLSFNRDIRPILSENCFACHGFDAKKREADLRLDVPEGAFLTKDDVTPIVPGNPEKSAVWQRIIATDADDLMPPEKSHKKLTPAQKDILKRWIVEGAPYQKHWAFEAPNLPPVPSGAQQPPAVIDAFLSARLAEDRLGFRPEADKPTLIRRVAFTLTGLPPTLAEVDAFLNDNSPKAYEAMVDRYLNSAHYGEEMARNWLDIARYADTHGLHLDNERSMWPFRDWVVKAFNEDLSFDDFTVWQIAGDLLPNATPDQITATGFSRCNVTTSEGGAIDEEYRHLYAVDRAATLTTTWLGLTGGCAQCHDHKFDPLSTQEFYSLYAFFFSSADPPMDKNISSTPPFLKLPTPVQQRTLDAAVKAEGLALKSLEASVHKAPYTDPATLKNAAEPQTITQVLFDDDFAPGTETRNTTRNPSLWRMQPDFGAKSGRRVLELSNGQFSQEVMTPVLEPVVLGQSPRFSVWVRLDPLNSPGVVCLELNGRRIAWGDAHVFDATTYGKDDTLTAGPLPKPGEWTLLSFDPTTLGLKTGSRINTIAVQQVGGTLMWDLCTVTSQMRTSADLFASFTAWWKLVSSGKKNPPGVPAAILNTLMTPPDKVTDAKAREALLHFYLAHVAYPANEEIAQLRLAWENAQVDRAAADDAIPGTLVFNDQETPRDTFIAMRGQYNKLGDKVEPATPASFPALKKTDPAGRATRLDLANWLVSPENPVAARVTVNRFWQQVFGIGLVKTSHDFGSQGEPPSHPELLDWLAVTFQKSGWKVKSLMKQMLMTQAFRQDAVVDSNLLSLDPENRLLARGPRIRLAAEQIRDNALFVSGLINLEKGGRGARTYQPPNIWEPVGYGDSNTRYYLQDHGPALYRRSLYCFLKRTAPPPFMSNFDAPNREQTCPRRERSNTPMQALQLMNDVQHFEAARALGERTLAEGGKDDAGRLQWLFRTVLSRTPDAQESALLTAALNNQRKLAAADVSAAQRVVSTGESAPKDLAPAPETAAWTLLANLVLNLDETVTRN